MPSRNLILGSFSLRLIEERSAGCYQQWPVRGLLFRSVHSVGRPADHLVLSVLADSGILHRLAAAWSKIQVISRKYSLLPCYLFANWLNCRSDGKTDHKVHPEESSTSQAHVEEGRHEIAVVDPGTLSGRLLYWRSNPLTLWLLKQVIRSLLSWSSMFGGTRNTTLTTCSTNLCSWRNTYYERFFLILSYLLASVIYVNLYYSLRNWTCGAINAPPILYFYCSSTTYSIKTKCRREFDKAMRVNFRKKSIMKQKTFLLKQ